MVFELRRYPFLGAVIEGAPEEYGVYLLWEHDELTYVGTVDSGSASIRTRLRDHFSGQITCACKPTHYSWRLSRSPGVLAREVLAEYRLKSQTEPRCNKTAA